MQLHPGDREAVNRNEVKKILKEKGVIGLGDQWPNDGGQPQKFQKEIRVGDVVLIRSDGPLALVKIISDCYQNSDNSVWFDLVRKIEILSLEGSLYKKEFNKHYQASWTDSLYLPKTIEIANNSPFIKFWYQDINGKVKMDNVINLLTYKHQIVLQGPPGTGKTRLAKLIAEKMTGSLLETGIFQGRPTVTISTVKNKTSEYIDTTNVMNSIQTALVKSGKVRFTRSINEMQQGVDELQRQNQSGLYKQGTTAKVGQMTAARYSMEGELTSIVKQNAATKDVYYKFTLKLFDVEEGTIEWQDEKEIRKTSKR